MSRTQLQKWTLTLSEDSYASQNSQSPNTARILHSYLPLDDGALHRELPEPFYLSQRGQPPLPGPIVSLFEFDQVIPGFPPTNPSTIVRHYFCAARTDFVVGTKTCLLYQNTGSAWAQVTAVGILADAPMAVTQENNLFLSAGNGIAFDPPRSLGVANWMFDGTTWIPDGMKIPLNQPAINVNNGVPTVLFGPNPVTAGTGTSSVTLYFYSNNSGTFAGAFSLNYPTLIGSALATATGDSLLFNPPQFNGITDPNVQPIEWATLNTAGAITGYVVPWAGATQGYAMSVVCSLVIPAPGNYTITFQHDDGSFFGFGAGTTNAVFPTLTGGGTVNVWQTKTATQGYPVLAGTNKSGNWNDTAIINFPQADTYPLEICYTNWENEQQLVFMINGANPIPASSTNPGVLSASIGKYYWFSNADETPGRTTESSTSPIGLVTGPLVGATVDIYQQPGLFTSNAASKIVQGSNSTDSPGPTAPQLDPTMAGKVLYLNGVLEGTIYGVGHLNNTYTVTSVSAPDANGYVTYTGSFSGGTPVVNGANNAWMGEVFSMTGFVNGTNNITNLAAQGSSATALVFYNPTGVAETHAAVATAGFNKIFLVANAATSITNGRAVITDSKATHWHVYASESDGSKLGQYLQIPAGPLVVGIPVTQNLAVTPVADTSPFIDDITNSYLPIYRPLRNDPPPPSKLLTVHKVRQFRRREALPAFFNFTANEEVTSGNNGDPAQCVPGADINTVSDMVNEVSFPDQSTKIRGFQSHNDALYMYSEKQCFPLYGQSVDDFSISQTQAFSCGLAGRFAVKSTPHGLPFITYDRKAQLYPMQSTLWALNPKDVNAGSALTEIGKPQRNNLAKIDPNRLDEVVTEYYLYGIRDWWVVSYPLIGGGASCYVYDFSTKGWFQLQRGFSSLAVFEVSEGEMVLVGGGLDGNVYVIDDQTGTFSTAGTLPQSTFRTALIDFGDPSVAHVFRYLELEFSSQAMQADTTISIWLDPNDVDNPGTPKKIDLKPSLGANRYRAFVHGNGTCERALIQIQTRASVNGGVIRGLKMAADTVTGLIGQSGHVGGSTT